MKLNEVRKRVARLARTSAAGKSRWIAAAVLPAVALSAAMLRPPPAGAADAMGAQAKRGEVVFRARCINCHNKQPGDTTPFGPPNLNGIFRGPNAVSTRDAEDIIVNGKGQMPGWGKMLTRGDIDDVMAYLKTLSPPETTGK